MRCHEPLLGPELAPEANDRATVRGTADGANAKRIGRARSQTTDNDRAGLRKRAHEFPGSRRYVWGHRRLPHFVSLGIADRLRLDHQFSGVAVVDTDDIGHGQWRLPT